MPIKSKQLTQGLFVIYLLVLFWIIILNYAYLFLNLNENVATPSFYL
ncbi:hypothetical protein [Loigolactobacillus zhaoyuanensis]